LQIDITEALPAALTFCDFYINGTLYCTLDKVSSLKFAFDAGSTNPFTAGTPIAVRLKFK